MDFFSNWSKLELNTNIYPFDALNDNSTLLILATNNKQNYKLSHNESLINSLENKKVFINNRDALLFKEKIKIIASCQNKTPQKIHNSLKRQYNYHSYLDLDKEKYNLIMRNLNLYIKENCR